MALVLTLRLKDEHEQRNPYQGEKGFTADYWLVEVNPLSPDRFVVNQYVRVEVSIDPLSKDNKRIVRESKRLHAFIKNTNPDEELKKVVYSAKKNLPHKLKLEIDPSNNITNMFVQKKWLNDHNV